MTMHSWSDVTSRQDKGRKAKYTETVPHILSARHSARPLQDVVDDVQNEGEHPNGDQEPERTTPQQAEETAGTEVLGAEREVGTESGEAEAQDGDDHDGGRQVCREHDGQDQCDGAGGQGEDGVDQGVKPVASAVALTVVAVVERLQSGAFGAGSGSSFGKVKCGEGVHDVFCFL